MPSRITQDYFRIHEQNISFYDAIAGNYDSNLDREISNQIVRKKVEEKFHEIVKKGSILDFGGGTGKDLEWLIKKGYRIFFCEPSERMIEIAVKQNKNILQSNNILFLDRGKSDFTQWHKEPPFHQKVDAILSNFAVINCIPDIDLLFRNLALVTKPGGHLIALILHKKYRKTTISWLYQEVMSFLYRKPNKFQIRYREHQQTVWIYSIRNIKSSSSSYFYFKSKENLSMYGFSMIHLIRK